MYLLSVVLFVLLVYFFLVYYFRVDDLRGARLSGGDLPTNQLAVAFESQVSQQEHHHCLLSLSYSN